MKNQLLRTVCATALAVGSVALPGVLVAQEVPDQSEVIDALPASVAETPNDGDTIVVTGTLIRGTPEDSALPVDVFSQEELSAEGQTSPLDFIKDIPAVGGVIGDSNQFQVQGLGAVGTINLRGLGAQRTLVLLNGHRTIVSPGDGLVDTNLIPVFALQRVELLKDGAAVTYGSDAVAGVANFITRTNFTGIEIQGDYKFIDDSDGDWTASILGGIDVGDDVNLLAGLGYRHRSPLAAFERDFSNQPPEVNPSPYSGVVNPAQYIPALRLTGPLRDRDPTGVKPAPFGTRGATTLLLGSGVQDVGCTELGGSIQAANGRCLYQYTDFNNLVEESNFYQGYVSINADLDDRTRFNADALYAFSEAFTKLSPSYPATQGPQGPGLTLPFFVPSSNPGYATFLQQTGATFSPAANGVVTTLYRPFALGGYPLSDGFPYGNDSFSKNESFRISAGLERDLTENIVASIQGTYIDASSRAAVQDTIGVRFQNALDGLGGPDCDVATGTPGQGNCYYFNPFSNAIAGNPVTGQLNPFYTGPGGDDPRTNNNRADVIDFFTEPAAANRQKEYQYVVDALLSGLTGFDLGAGPIGFGIGAQYRKSEYKLVPTNFSNAREYPCQSLTDQVCPFPLGPFVFQGPLAPANTQQDVYAVFGEVQVPILDALDINLALRFEDYGEPIGSTIDPKGSFRFEPLEWLVLRGSIGTTFRAPLAGQVAPGRQFVNLTGINAAGGFFFPVDRFGNPELGPETALTYNIGAVINTGGFNLQVDYFNYDFEGPLGNQPENPIVSAVFNRPGNTTDCTSPVASLVVFNSGVCTPGVSAAAGLARVQTSFVNGPDVRTNGLDVEADYTVDFGQAALTMGTALTHIFNYDVDAFVINGVDVIPAYDAVGFLNADRSQASLPRWKINSYLNLNAGGLNARYVFRYASGLRDARYDTDPTFGNATTYGRDIDAATQHDLTVLYDLPFDFARVQLQGTVENIFDEDPPRTRQVLGYDPYVGNPLGRVFRLGAKLNF